MDLSFLPLGSNLASLFQGLQSIPLTQDPTFHRTRRHIFHKRKSRSKSNTMGPIGCILTSTAEKLLVWKWIKTTYWKHFWDMGTSSESILYNTGVSCSRIQCPHWIKKFSKYGVSIETPRPRDGSRSVSTWDYSPWITWRMSALSHTILGLEVVSHRVGTFLSVLVVG